MSQFMMKRSVSGLVYRAADPMSTEKKKEKTVNLSDYLPSGRDFRALALLYTLFGTFYIVFVSLKTGVKYNPPLFSSVS